MPRVREPSFQALVAVEVSQHDRGISYVSLQFMECISGINIFYWHQKQLCVFEAEGRGLPVLLWS